MRPAADADPQAPPANGAERVEQVLRVEQSRIDRLMDLVGELVVAKNAPPCLARRAVRELGDREFARAIKSRRSALDRISNDMQNAMMAVRLVPVARRFQRFPRLVRDMSRKPGKDIRLAMEGQDTEADRTVIEALSEPLVHLVRNAVDHGLEQDRTAAGKRGPGKLSLCTEQVANTVQLEVRDDGAGIDWDKLGAKAREHGRTLDTEADRVDWLFSDGVTSRDEVSELSGRGVGTAAVRESVTTLGGTIHVESELGRFTRFLIAVPLDDGAEAANSPAAARTA